MEKKKAVCQRCHGRGYYFEEVPGTVYAHIPDFDERYCLCDKGKELSEKES